MKPGTPFLKNISLALAGVFLCALLVETGLRISGFTILALQEHRNRAALKNGGAYRILCLGESTTQGQWPPFLKDALDRAGSGAEFTVIDEGRGGTNSGAILSRLAPQLDKYRPDMVIAMMGVNDPGSTQVPYEPPSPSRTASFFGSLKTYRLIRLLLHMSSVQDTSLFFPPGTRAPAAQPAAAPQALPVREPDPKRLARVKDLERELAAAPLDSKLLAALGWAYLELPQETQAQEQFKKALEIDPASGRANTGMGFLDLQQNQLQRAEGEFKTAISADPSDDMAHLGLARVYLNMDQFQRGKEQLDKAIALNKNNDMAYAWLGRAYMKQGRLPEAEAPFKKATALNPGNDTAYVGLGWLYQRQGLLQKAEEQYKKAYAANPGTEACIGLGQIYMLQRNFKAAEEQFRTALLLNPGDDTAASALQMLRLEQREGASGAEEAGPAAEGYRETTAVNYRALKAVLDKRKIRLVCVQYPMRSVAPLKSIFAAQANDVIFVDNERVFRDAVKKDGYQKYFRDLFGGNFGHATAEGNKLLGDNIAGVILKELQAGKPQE